MPTMYYPDRHHIEWKGRCAREYTDDFIYMKVKTRQNISAMMDSRRVITFVETNVKIHWATQLRLVLLAVYKLFHVNIFQ